jgi:hypothetical protein
LALFLLPIIILCLFDIAVGDPAAVLFWGIAKFLNDYSNTITALSGVAVAGFTFTLWRSTDKLWISAEKQRENSDRQYSLDRQDTTNSLRIAARAATAMEEANKVSREHLVAAERPWLNASIEVLGEIRFIYDGGEETGCSLGFSISLKNFGKSPATEVQVSAHLIIGASETPWNFLDYQINLSNSMLGWRDRSQDDIIFPGETRIIPQLRLANYSDTIETRSSNAVRVFVVGCVHYGFPFSKGHHQAWFSGEVRLRANSNLLLDRTSGNIPAESLFFQQVLGANKFAD